MRPLLLLVLSALINQPACVSGPRIAWRELTGESAFAEAKAAGKPLLLKFDAEWCPYCNHMDETVFRDQAVVALADKFLCVRIDGDKGTADALMKHYAVRGYPTIVFASTDGQQVGRTEYEPSAVKFATLMREVTEDGVASRWRALVRQAMPESQMPDDPYWVEGDALKEKGDTEGAKAVYRRGGFVLLAQIHRVKWLAEVRSHLSGTISLLREGGALDEAAQLAKQAVAVFPNQFLYHLKYASILEAQGELTEAITEGERAFTLSYGRNRVTVGDQLSEMLVTKGDTARATAVIHEALQAVDWSTNTRQKEAKSKTKMEERLAELQQETKTK